MPVDLYDLMEAHIHTCTIILRTHIGAACVVRMPLSSPRRRAARPGGIDEHDAPEDVMHDGVEQSLGDSGFGRLDRADQLVEGVECGHRHEAASAEYKREDLTAASQLGLDVFRVSLILVEFGCGRAVGAAPCLGRGSALVDLSLLFSGMEQAVLAEDVAVVVEPVAKLCQHFSTDNLLRDRVFVASAYHIDQETVYAGAYLRRFIGVPWGCSWAQWRLCGRAGRLSVCRQWWCCGFAGAYTTRLRCSLAYKNDVWAVVMHPCRRVHDPALPPTGSHCPLLTGRAR